MPKIPDRFVVFDLETTGLSPSKNEIIEIGAIKVDLANSTHPGFKMLVKPKGRVSARISQLTGITQSMIDADGVPLANAIADFSSFCERLPLVSFNASFDRRFLYSACENLQHPHFKHRSICALQMARKAWPYRPSHRLTDLCLAAGISVADEHRALADCERALRIFVLSAMALGWEFKQR